MERRKINGRGVVTVAVLVFLGLFFVINFALVREPMLRYFNKEITFKELAEEVRTNYTSDEFSGKESFINTNGLFARVLGMREYNDVILLKNGMLSKVLKKKDMTEQADAIIALADYTKEQNIPFLYVQAPYKEDTADTLYPTGRKSYGNENADDILQLLKDGGVETFDLRPMLSETAEQVEQYFFFTDHHWNFAGAFVGFQQVAAKIAELFPEKEIDLTYTQWDMWESHTIKNWLLGSRGKRVGYLFAGLDDVTWYTPKFETEQSRTVPKQQYYFSGDFEGANLQKEFIGEEKDYFVNDTYCLYTGKDYALVQHKNRLPVTDMKILIIKDSFTKPMQAYLSTMFSEIDVIDPRHFAECSVAEYIRRTEPDFVMLMMNPSLLAGEGYESFGVDEVAKVSEEVISWTGDIAIAASDSKNKQDSSLKLEGGKTYTIRFRDVEFTEGTSEAVAVALYNETKKKKSHSTVFDLEYGRENGEFVWTVSTPAGSDKWCLRMYAGIPEETKGNGVVYQEVVLSEWE